MVLSKPTPVTSIVDLVRQTTCVSAVQLDHAADVISVSALVSRMASDITLYESNDAITIAIERDYDSEDHAAHKALAIAQSVCDDGALYKLARKARDTYLSYYLLSTVYARTSNTQVREDATLALLVITKEGAQKYDETILLGERILNEGTYHETHMLYQAALQLMGDAYAKKMQYAQAINYYRRVYELNHRANVTPIYPAILIADMYANLTEYAEAERYLKHAQTLVNSGDGMQSRIDNVRRKIYGN